MFLIILKPKIRNVAQPGSALAWGARGRGFKSRRSDNKKFYGVLFLGIQSQTYNNFVRIVCNKFLIASISSEKFIGNDSDFCCC